MILADEVGVIVPWDYPLPDAKEIQRDDIMRIHTLLNEKGPWRYDQKSSREPWVGFAIAEVLSLPAKALSKKERAEIAAIIKEGVRGDWLRVVTEQCPLDRKKHDYVKAGKVPEFDARKAGAPPAYLDAAMKRSGE